MRPAHIHVVAHAPHHPELVTQMYFDGDPYLEADPLELTDLAGDPAHAGTIAVLEGELRQLVHPEAEDRRAKEHQGALLEAAGGAEAVIAKGSPGYTPAPGEAPRFA